jgi:hypothetical protein
MKIEKFNEEKKWIKDAIKKPGSLIKYLKKEEGEELTKTEIAKTLKSFKENKETSNYMFFGNLETIKRMVDELLEMDEQVLDKILSEHDWASDHISVATENLEQVFNFLSNYSTTDETEETEEVKSFKDFNS